LDIKKVAKTLNAANPIKQSESMLKLANEVERFNQTSMWGYNVVDTLHAVRRAQAINSSIKSAGLKYITQYIKAEAADRVYIDHTDIGPFYAKKEEYWLNIQNGKYKKVGIDPTIDEACSKHSNVYIKTTGDDLVERYLDDDLEETLTVDEEFNQGSFLLASLVPTTYERVSTMGTATLWEIQMRAWSYKHKLAIPAKNEKTEFVGGLSRLLKVGYSTDVLKLDFSSLYPSIQLVHDVFPTCDITGAMKGMLNYFRNTRIKYKNLAKEYQDIDKKQATSYDRKQLPIKIFINSMFGALSAPQVYHWGDMYMGEQITCTGRQYLRQMLRFFMKRGYTPLVCDTDGMNFSLPEGGVDGRTYIGKGNNWLVKEGKEYKGYDADVAEFNDTFMKGAMGLDCDGTWKSCMNIARKNYATMEHNGKIKLTGNSIKSKKLPLYIEDFLDKGIKMLLEGDGQSFVEWYYEYLEVIFNQQIPLMKIAQRAKVKLSIDDYNKRSKEKTKAGNEMSRMAHMELAMRDGIAVSLGDVIFYVNNGVKASHGDVQKVNDKMSKKEKDEYKALHGKDPVLGSHIQLNCYRLNPAELESNPGMTGEYNVARAVVTFNKRIEPLLIVFGEEVRNNLIVTDPKDRGLFTKDQCKLINGIPFEPADQDSIEDLLTITDQEKVYWEKRGINPEYIYELAEEGWENMV
jgi:DNA polymerase elongation subunit (family B)